MANDERTDVDRLFLALLAKVEQQSLQSADEMLAYYRGLVQRLGGLMMNAETVREVRLLEPVAAEEFARLQALLEAQWMAAYPEAISDGLAYGAGSIRATAPPLADMVAVPGPDIVAGLTSAYGEASADQVRGVVGRAMDSLRTSARAIALAAGSLKRNLIAKVLGRPLTAALSTGRTQRMDAVRFGIHTSWDINRFLVKGWTRVSALTTNTCFWCVAQHGEHHSMDETLDDHKNGLCMAVPDLYSPLEMGFRKLLGWPVPEVAAVKGLDWLKSQPPDVLDSIIGVTRRHALDEGLLGWDDLHDGDRLITLKELGLPVWRKT